MMLDILTMVVIAVGVAAATGLLWLAWGPVWTLLHEVLMYRDSSKWLSMKYRLRMTFRWSRPKRRDLRRDKHV